MRRSLLLPLCACALCAVSACAGPPPPRLLDESERGVDVGAALHVAVHDGAGGAHTVRSVKGDEPGESELELDGKPLAPAPGPDDLPLLVEVGGADGADGLAVVFVSGRSGVASLWRVDVDGGGLRQLTNAGLRPGHLDERFVPTPARTMSADDGAVTYDDGSGRVWRVDLARGTATSTRPAAAGPRGAQR